MASVLSRVTSAAAQRPTDPYETPKVCPEERKKKRGKKGCGIRGKANHVTEFCKMHVYTGGFRAPGGSCRCVLGFKSAFLYRFQVFLFFKVWERYIDK